jgi:hypothetical protein
MDLLLKLKEHFPSFKVSLFTVPIDEKKDWGPYTLREDYLKLIKENLDWMQIIPHGYIHNGSEMKRMEYGEFKHIVLPAIMDAFKKDGLPYEHGFKPPHWRWNEGVVRALDEIGWWGAVDPRQPRMECPKKFYKHNCSIDDIDYSLDILKLHGHVYGTRNDLGKCFDNLLKIPKSATWHFVTEFLEDKK